MEHYCSGIFKNLKENMLLCFVYVLSCVQLFVTPQTVGCQALLSMEFSRQEYWSRLPFPTPEDLDPGIQPRSPASPVSSMFPRAVWMKGLKIREQGVLRPRSCRPTFLVHLHSGYWSHSSPTTREALRF